MFHTGWVLGINMYKCTEFKFDLFNYPQLDYPPIFLVLTLQRAQDSSRLHVKNKENTE